KQVRASDRYSDEWLERDSLRDLPQRTAGEGRAPAPCRLVRPAREPPRHRGAPGDASRQPDPVRQAEVGGEEHSFGTRPDAEAERRTEPRVLGAHHLTRNPELQRRKMQCRVVRQREIPADRGHGTSEAADRWWLPSASVTQQTASKIARSPASRKKNGQSRPVSRVLFRRVVAFPAAANIPLGPTLPPASSGLPGSAAGNRITPLCALAPGGACRAARVTTGAVRSYRTVSPLPAFAGGLFSVALSRELPRLAVGQHPALWSPDFPPARFESAGVRPGGSDQDEF